MGLAGAPTSEEEFIIAEVGLDSSLKDSGVKALDWVWTGEEEYVAWQVRGEGDQESRTRPQT